VKRLDLTFQTSFRLALACKRKSEPPKIGQTFKAHWSSAQALFSSPPGRGSLVLAAWAFQLAFLKRWLLEKPTRSASPLTSLLQSIRLNRRSLLLLQSHHTPQVFLAPQKPPRKGTGPGAALPDAFIEPFLATWGSIGCPLLPEPLCIHLN
jgi:hypothetical protein